MDEIMKVLSYEIISTVESFVSLQVIKTIRLNQTKPSVYSFLCMIYHAFNLHAMCAILCQQPVCVVLMLPLLLLCKAAAKVYSVCVFTDD